MKWTWGDVHFKNGGSHVPRYIRVKAKSELKSVGIDAQKNYPPLDCKEERSALSTNTHSEQWSEINKEQILEDLEEKLNESALDIHNDSMLSTSSAFSKDLIEACANASAEMLDLHLTPLRPRICPRISDFK